MGAMKNLWGILPYLSLLALAAGVVWRGWTWGRVPQPWAWPLTPAPAGPLGGVLRGLRETFLAPRLLVQRPWRWLVWAGLHGSLALILLRHAGFWLDPPPAWWPWLEQAARGAGVLLLLCLFWLLLRRLLSPQLIYISRAQDYLGPVLMLALALTGLGLAWASQADLAAVGAWARALARLEFPPPPLPGGLVTGHALLGLLLVAWFPWGRLFHFPAVLLGGILGRGLGGRRRPNPWEALHAGDSPREQALAPGDPPLATLEEYQSHLRRRWARAGSRRVLGAGQRAASLRSPENQP